MMVKTGEFSVPVGPMLAIVAKCGSWRRTPTKVVNTTPTEMQITAAWLTGLKAKFTSTWQLQGCLGGHFKVQCIGVQEWLYPGLLVRLCCHHCPSVRRRVY